MDLVLTARIWVIEMTMQAGKAEGAGRKGEPDVAGGR